MPMASRLDARFTTSGDEMKEFILKYWHYDGGTSVVEDFDSLDDAIAERDRLNRDSQSENYYVQRNWNYAY